jgi:transcriptional regulator with XRE-family HTH domain
MSAEREDCAQGVIRVGDVEFVLVSVEEYLRLGGDPSRLKRSAPPGTRERGQLAKRVSAARRHVGLTQAALAERLGKSQAVVSHAESGAARIGERYVQAVLTACALKPNWGSRRRSKKEPEPELALKDIAGLDPVTLEPVRRGSKRDLELRRTVVWWNDGYCGF